MVADTEPVTATFVLIHSPLVAPITWSWAAQELQQRKQRTIVPSLSGAVLSGSWQACVDVAVEAAKTSEHAVLVGHSGAGPLLPLIASGMHPPPTRLVFVDAGLPPDSGHAPLMPATYLSSLRVLAQDGVLPPWSEWFGPDVIETLVPDAERRAAVVASLPRVPLSYFESQVHLPHDWSAVDGAYILLSEAYRSDATAAASHGWPVIEMLGGHLDLVIHPAELADALTSVAAP